MLNGGNTRTLKKLISILLLLSILCVNMLFTPMTVYATNGCVIQKVYTDKAMYNQDDTVTVTVVIKNPGASQVTTPLNYSIYQLQNTVTTNSTNVTVPANTTINQNITWTAPSTNYTGYLVKVDLGDGVYATTAVDVSSDIKKFPRYGYTTDFPVGETQEQSVFCNEKQQRNPAIFLNFIAVTLSQFTRHLKHKVTFVFRINVWNFSSCRVFES